MADTQPLNLMIEDADDLAAVSVHVQDAILRLSDIHRLARLRRVAFVMNRFRWEKAGKRLKPLERVRSGLHFNYVTGMRAHGLAEDRKTEFLVLLAISFEPRDAPSGLITLSFAGGATLMLQVECIDGGLVDIGAPWRTANRPRHAN